MPHLWGAPTYQKDWLHTPDNMVIWLNPVALALNVIINENFDGIGKPF